MYKIKFVALFIACLFVSSLAVANPCGDFIDDTKISDPMFHEAGPKLCLIDIRLAQKTKFISRHVVMTEEHGQMEFLFSDNGNLAVVVDVLSVTGIPVNINGGIDRIVREVIRDVVNCVRDPACREMVRDTVRDFFVGEAIGRAVDSVREYFGSDK